MKSLKMFIFVFLAIIHVTFAFANRDGKPYRPMVSDGEIITVYSVDDPKRLPTIEEVRTNLKKKKNISKDLIDDQKNKDPESDASDEEEDASEEASEDEDSEDTEEDDEEE